MGKAIHGEVDLNVQKRKHHAHHKTRKNVQANFYRFFVAPLSF